MEDKIEFPKPIIKWIGGKSQIVERIIKEFPPKINNYYEPFLGGGSVLLALLYSIKNGMIQINGKVHASDINQPLIYLYKNIQSNHEELYSKIIDLIVEYHKCPYKIKFKNLKEGGDEQKDEDPITEEKKVNRNPLNIEEALKCKETYYFWIRKKYNELEPSQKMSVTGSAMFIFLNKTCFRGLFRIGPRGFNVPYGNYINPSILNKTHLDEIHHLIKDVIFECGDYKNYFEKMGDGDFIYLDPPYAPESEKSFVNYTENGFGEDDHHKLFELCNGLGKDKKMLLNNADVPLVRASFPETKFIIQSLLCKRSINAKNPKAKAKEVIIMN
jgi:DNA adenine methylase